MTKLFKTLGYLTSVLCFVLCLMGAAKVLQNAPDDLWRGLGIFMLGIGIFAGIALLMLSVGLSSAKKEVETTQHVQQKVETVLEEIKKVPVKRESGNDKPATSGPANVYVGNIAPAASESDLREEFEVFGAVKSVRIMADRETGEPKGYAFVEMANRSDAKLAIEDINGQEIKGQEVKVMFARPKRRGGPRKKKS